jgi:CRISPR/Cas system-associated exonuclease Cas4 (RecB family)
MKPLPVSHSRLSQFVNCPKQYHEVIVLKRVQDSVTEEGIWGNRVHKHFEQSLKSNTPLPEEFGAYQAYLDEIRKVTGEMQVEVKLAIDTNLQPCDFFAPNVFMRAVADVLHLQQARALAMDHKTGKPKTESRQLMMTALLVFHTYPHIEVCKTGYFWLRTQSKTTEVFYREQLQDMWQELLPDIKQYKHAFDTDTWQPRQSGLCNGWCPVHDCEYWRPKGNSRRR